MNLIALEYAPALPEIVLGIGICVVLLVDLYLPDRYRDPIGITCLSLVSSADESYRQQDFQRGRLVVCVRLCSR